MKKYEVYYDNYDGVDRCGDYGILLCTAGMRECKNFIKHVVKTSRDPEYCARLKFYAVLPSGKRKVLEIQYV